jgi:hypothetical protein
VPGFTLGDDRRYDISERDASLSRRRPPLSRNSTEEEPLSTSIGTRTITDSLSDASHEEIGQKIHRSRTEAVGDRGNAKYGQDRVRRAEVLPAGRSSFYADDGSAYQEGL